MKITGQIEEIFAQAVALDQSGGLKNTIYANSREVFILNFDHTVLLRFRLRASELPFKEPICFRANDYESNEFKEENGRIIFISEKNGFQRKKSCKVADYTPADIKSIFSKYLNSPMEKTNKVNLSHTIVELLDTNLSHIEFSGKVGEPLKMVQRNIYSGGIIEVQEQTNSGFWANNIEYDFGPVGIKTGDFISLFNFQDNLSFEFPSAEIEDYVLVKSIDKNKRDMVGIIGLCIYDEIIQTRELNINKENHGGQITQIRRSQQKTDSGLKRRQIQRS